MKQDDGVSKEFVQGWWKGEAWVESDLVEYWFDPKVFMFPEDIENYLDKVVQTMFSNIDFGFNIYNPEGEMW